MFIVIISRGIPSKREPQWGCFEKDQAEALSAIGHKVVVISVDSRFRLYWRKPGISHFHHNNVDYYDCFMVPGVIVRMLFGEKSSISFEQAQLKRVLNRVIQKYGRPDILYSHYLHNSYVALGLKNMYNLPLVAIEHWSQLNNDILSDYAVRLGKATYRECDAVIAVSESLKLRLCQHFQIDSFVVYNMVGSKFFFDSPQKDKFGKLRFVSTGGLIYRKGYDLLIAAFNQLKLPLDKWELTIIGGGEERVNLERQINQVGLKGNIHLVGQKKKEDIVEILSQSDVFVLPSRNENFSVAVLEALCEGLPVIASACGGIRECIDVSNGLLFPVDDIDSLAEAIKTMYGCYNKYDRKKIAADSWSRFSPEVIARQLTQVFEKVIR